MSDSIQPENLPEPQEEIHDLTQSSSPDPDGGIGGGDSIVHPLPDAGGDEKTSQVEESKEPVYSKYTPPAIKPQNIVNDLATEPVVQASKYPAPSERKSEKDIPPTEVAMPSSLDHVMNAASEELAENSTVDAQWLKNLEATNFTSADGEYESALSDPESTWSRFNQSENKRFGSTNLKAGSIEGREVAGDQALMAFRSFRKGSAGARVLFYNSGVALKFEKQDNTDLYQISREIFSSRINAGRSSYAKAMSQHMTYTADVILEAARSSLISSSCKEGVDIGDMIKITDFHTLVWGLAMATWPQGTEITRSCIASPNECHFITREHLNIHRMQLVRQSMLSDAQRAWLATLKDGRDTLEDLQKYQTQFAKLPTNRYSTIIDDKEYVFNLKVPTINEFISSGKIWIDEIGAAVNRSIGQEASFADRNKMYSDLMFVATARQYSHWVESIEFSGGEVKEPDSIRMLLGAEISEDNDLMPFFIESVRDFNEKSTASVIAIPNFQCPECKKWQTTVEGSEEDAEQPTTYTPVETVGFFLSLMGQKLSQ